MEQIFALDERDRIVTEFYSNTAVGNMELNGSVSEYERSASTTTDQYRDVTEH